MIPLTEQWILDFEFLLIWRNFQTHYCQFGYQYFVLGAQSLCFIQVDHFLSWLQSIRLFFSSINDAFDL